MTQLILAYLKKSWKRSVWHSLFKKSYELITTPSMHTKQTNKMVCECFFLTYSLSDILTKTFQFICKSKVFCDNLHSLAYWISSLKIGEHYFQMHIRYFHKVISSPSCERSTCLKIKYACGSIISTKLS